jgi:hypothetical protein
MLREFAKILSLVGLFGAAIVWTEFSLYNKFCQFDDDIAGNWRVNFPATKSTLVTTLNPPNKKHADLEMKEIYLMKVVEEPEIPGSCQQQQCNKINKSSFDQDKKDVEEEMEIREMNDGLKDNTDEKYFPKFSKPIF